MKDLNYFDEQLNNAQQHKASDLPDEIFWIDSIPKRKKTTLLMPVLIIFLAAALVLLFFAMTRIVFGKGWLKNQFDNTKRAENGFEYNLPLADRPELEGDGMYLSDGRYTVEGLAKALSPSVVSILSYEKSDVAVTAGQGSGIIFTDDGFIVTNAHVVSGYNNTGIRVRLHNGEAYNAKIVGSDEATDIAVLKITAKNLTPAQFGDSDQVVLGEQIVALGCPAGLDGTISSGIVSGLDRQINIAEVNAVNCIQVDAPINPGNSGGALCNMWGQVIGIVSAKLEAQDYEGIGFAISTTAAKPIVEDLIEYGCVRGRVKIGISFFETDSEDSDKVQTDVQGLLIVEVESDCDIAKSGLKPGDIITHIDGQAVLNADDVTNILNEHIAGDELDFVYVSDGKTITSSFVLMDNSNSLTVKE